MKKKIIIIVAVALVCCITLAVCTVDVAQAESDKVTITIGPDLQFASQREFCTQISQTVQFDDVGKAEFFANVWTFYMNGKQYYDVDFTCVFTPGKIMMDNDNYGYGNYLNSLGYVHANVQQAYLRQDDEILYGGKVNFLGYQSDYHDATYVTTTVTSKVFRGLKLLEFTKIKRENLRQTALLDVSTDTASWLYSFNKAKRQQVGFTGKYIFEYSQTDNQLQQGDFVLNLDFKMIGQRGLSKVEKFATLQLLVRPSTKQAVPFSDGVI